MIEITVKEALNKIKEVPYLNILWVKEECPACEQFEYTLDSITEELNSWESYKIVIGNHAIEVEGAVTFEPSVFPSHFIFKEGSRVVVGQGSFPRETIRDILSSTESGEYRTEESIEQAQLDALD